RSGPGQDSPPHRPPAPLHRECGSNLRTGAGYCGRCGHPRGAAGPLPGVSKALAGCGGQRPMGRESERRRGTMIQLMKRILAVSGRYKRRIQIAFVFSFLKSLLAKAPIMLAFLVLSSFYAGTITAGDCLWYGIALVVCVLLQVLFHHIADRLQSAAGFLVFLDMRMELGAHLRRMPMGYFTEGNIGKISSVL